MPRERVANGGNFDIFLGFMDSCDVEISVGIQKGNLSLKSLFKLVEIDLNDGQVVLNSEI